MLGSLSDAQDVVQDAYLRWHKADRDAVREPRAFLTTIVTRLCLDQMKSAQARRETYKGPWLPEPLIEPLGDGGEQDSAIDAPVALMLALERLSPLERATFLLHDILDVGFPEIARILERGEAACRQLAVRVRENVRLDRKRFSIAADEARRVIDAFFTASRSGNADQLKHLLAESVAFHADGGGKVRAALRIISGADEVSRFFTGIAERVLAAGRKDLWVQPVRINGLPGFASVGPDGHMQTTAIETEDGAITAIYIVRNPDKLNSIVPLIPPSLR